MADLVQNEASNVLDVLGGEAPHAEDVQNEASNVLDVLGGEAPHAEDALQNEESNVLDGIDFSVLGGEAPYAEDDHEHEGFGNIENIPHEDINWALHDTWSRDLELAHFDEREDLHVAVAVSGDAVSNVTANLPDVDIDDPTIFELWFEELDKEQ